MALTRTEVRGLCRAYPLLRLKVAGYFRQREAILSGGSTSVIKVTVRAAPGDPTLGRVMSLEALGYRYGRTLFVVKAIEDCVGGLPEQERKLFDFYFCEGLPIRQVAAKLDMAVSTCHRRLSELLDTLAVCLGRFFEEE